MLTPFIKQVVAGTHLSTEQVTEAFGAIMDGGESPAQIAALLVALRMKGETVDEILGAALAMRARMTQIGSTRTPLLDTCGTGGDGAGTFNISTAVAFVAAAAGVAVAKHGNRAVSSRSGSADVLAAAGVNIEAPQKVVERCLAEVGIAFLFAPSCHPAMRHAGPVRRELGVRTLFNVLGPLTNPAGARRQLLGVFHHSLLAPLAEVLGRLGSEHAWVVCGEDGLDELTVCADSLVAEWRDGKVTERRLRPEALGLERHPEGSLKGGNPEENAALLKELLGGGGPKPLIDAVSLNAAAAIFVGGGANSIEDGLQRARQVMQDGAGLRLLQQLAAASAA